MTLLLCPICSANVLNGQNVMMCASCHRIYHRECWEYNLQHCGLFGCNGVSGISDEGFSADYLVGHFDLISDKTITSNPNSIAIRDPKTINHVNINLYWITTLFLSAVIYGFLGLLLYFLVILFTGVPSINIFEIDLTLFTPLVFILVGCASGVFSSFAYNLLRSITGDLKNTDYFFSLLVPAGICLIFITGGFLIFSVIAVFFVVIFLLALAGGG